MLVRAHQIRSADETPVSNKMFLFGNECVNDIDFLQIFDSDSEILESKVRGEIVNAGRHLCLTFAALDVILPYHFHAMIIFRCYILLFT